MAGQTPAKAKTSAKAKTPAKAKARAKAKPKTKLLKDMTPDERLQWYLDRGKEAQASLIAESVERFGKGLPREHNRIRRWICNVKGCVFGDNNNKSDVGPHFKEGRNPHPEHTCNVKDILDIDHDDYLEDKDLKASAAATTKQEFYDILNQNLAGEYNVSLVSYTANASTAEAPSRDDATDEYLATWPNVRDDWRDDWKDSKGFFESEEE